MRVRHIAFKLYYDGSAFHGFQRQPGVRTVEGEILRVLGSHDYLYGGPREALYSAAGRTDAGVHALGQVVGFLSTCDPLDAALLVNRELEPQVYVWGIRGDALPGFHARYWAVERTYAYLADPPPGADPFLAETVLSGFRGLRRYPVESGSPYRRVTRIGVELWEGFLVIKVSGDSFARRQVRRMVGMVEAAAQGSYASYASVKPADPERLVLLDVVYPFSFHVPRSLAEGLERLVCGKEGPIHRYLCRHAASLSGGAGT